MDFEQFGKALEHMAASIEVSHFMLGTVLLPFAHFAKPKLSQAMRVMWKMAKKSKGGFKALKTKVAKLG